KGGNLLLGLSIGLFRFLPGLSKSLLALFRAHLLHGLKVEVAERRPALLSDFLGKRFPLFLLIVAQRKFLADFGHAEEHRAWRLHTAGHPETGTAETTAAGTAKSAAAGPTAFLSRRE